MDKRVTLADVSRAAGVGAATVSRALGDHPDVSAATRQRVREVAQHLGYRPSIAARALRGGGFRAISAIVPDSAWGWWEPVIHSAFDAAAEAGYQLMVHPIAGIEGGAASVVDGLASMPTEGVIVISVPDQASVRRACDDIGLPAVAIDDTAPDIQFPTVSPRNREGARAVVTHLIEQGRSSIALLRATLSPADAQWGAGLFIDEREAGYRQAHADAGIAVDESLIIDVAQPFAETANTWPELDALLDGDKRIDGLFCIADLMAPPAYRTLRAHGLSIPDDVAVAGFDDERAALLVDPQLTTVRQPYRELGSTAVRLLLQAIHGEAVPNVRHELDTEVVLRASSTVS
jgi:LacI family transcriptional regulator